jgi:NitT/TauT family transport system substrate-binding protein
MRYRFAGVSAVAVAIALVSGGCSASNGPGAPQVEKHDLVVGAVPVADSAALYIAQQQGFFRAEGLHVKIETVVSGATAISGQLAGKYDVVLGNYVSYVLADAVHNDKFRILAPGAADSPDDSVLLVPDGSRIQSLADLKGKTIGVNALNNIATLIVTSLLDEHQIGVQQDHIHFKAIPFPDMSHALQSHEVDAAWMVEPFVTLSEMAGAQPLADTDQGATQNLPIAGYMVTQSWEKKYPGTAAAFRHALLQGQEVASRNLPAVWHGLETFAKIPAGVAELIALPSYPQSIQAIDLQRIPNLMLLYNMIGHSFDASQMLR